MEFLIEAISQPASTIALITVLCGVGIFVIISTLANQILGLMLYPCAVFTSLCVSKFFLDLHFYSHRAFDKWVLFTILSTAVGMALALTVYIILSRLFGLTRSPSRPADLNELRLRRIQLEANKS